MKGAIEKLEGEIMQQKKNNFSLQQHLDHLRVTLTNGFAGVKLPGMQDIFLFNFLSIFVLKNFMKLFYYYPLVS